MPVIECVRSVPVVRTPRVRQLEGLFDVPPAESSTRRWSVNLPLESRDWRVGLIVGPSGCGKTTLARELFPGRLQEFADWPVERSIVDAFPAALGIGEIAGLLSSVGFSSPPGWLRPFGALSHGEQFRVTIARALAEQPDLAVIDEFTSVVDRTVARIGSAAVARAVRRSGRRLVAVSCHYDIREWLDPDWCFDPSTGEFQWRSLRQPGAGHRPPLALEICRVGREAWRLFAPHHYLSGALHPAARCYAAFVGADLGDGLPEAGVQLDRPAAFTAVLPAPDTRGGYWREHRTVCLPDFQGVGIGQALSEFVAAAYVATGKRYCSRTSHPAMIGHRLRSPLWCVSRPAGFSGRQRGRGTGFDRHGARDRWTVSCRYVGPPDYATAAHWGLIPWSQATLTVKDPR